LSPWLAARGSITYAELGAHGSFVAAVATGYKGVPLSMSRIHSEYLDADLFDCSVVTDLRLHQEPDKEEDEEDDGEEEDDEDKEDDEGYSE
jgi:hypothetical protein